MKLISFKRHRFNPDVIRLAFWFYYRFTASLRDIEDMLAERGHMVSYETVRCWVNKFGPAFAANIRRRRGRADCAWHLDEMVVRIKGQRMIMWRAVDKEGEVLNVLVQKHRNKASALKLLRKLIKNQGAVPEQIVTDVLLHKELYWGASTCINPDDYARTTGLKTHIFPCDEENERCNASNPRGRPNVSFQPTQLSTTSSTFSLISLQESPCET